MAGMLTDRVREEGAQRVKVVARRIAKESPRLADLPAEDLERLTRVIVAEDLKDQLKHAAHLEKINLATEIATFLQRTGSPHTRRAYTKALVDLSSWCDKRRITILELSPATSDDWIADLKASGASPSTVRLKVAGVSSFLTWMERRHPEEVRNPIRGTRERPRAKSVRPLKVPSPEEVETLKVEALGELRAAIVIMADLGLRVGALPTMRINGSTFTSTSKGREIAGELPPEVKHEIAHAGLSARAPFEGVTAGHLADTFRWLVGRLHEAGKIRERYSVHDLRHSFATRLYLETRDVYRVSRALHHSGADITSRYLRSLGLQELAGK